MPVYSMTGYASTQHSSSNELTDSDSKSQTGRRLGLEIRSVNSRFLDLSFKLPDELRSFEPQLRELVSAKLKRGKVEVRASIESEDVAILPDPSPRLLQRLNSTQDAIQAWLPKAQPLSVAEVIRICGQNQASSTDWTGIIPVLAQQTIKELQAARQREGARLGAMLTGNLEQLRTLAQKAAPLIPRIAEQQRLRFLERWQEALNLSKGSVSAEAAQERALTEATAFAIRIDVAEELTRIHSHLDEIERLVNKGGEVGKKLDFLIQELHREANTMGSKSAALELTQISIEMKVLIEQMREQVQNIE